MTRKLRISLASSLSDQPAIASIFLDGQALMSSVSISAVSSNYSTHEFDIPLGNHNLIITMENDEMSSNIDDLNLIIGPIQLSKLDGTYHPNLYVIPNATNNLKLNNSPNTLVTRVLFSKGDELQFDFDSENPTLFRNYDEPLPVPPDFAAVTGQAESEWNDGQIAIYDELKYQCQAINDVDSDTGNPIVIKNWILMT